MKRSREFPPMVRDACHEELALSRSPKGRD